MNFIEMQMIMSEFETKHKDEAHELLHKYPMLQDYSKYIASGFDAFRGIRADKSATAEQNFEGLLFISFMLYQFVCETRGEL